MSPEEPGSLVVVDTRFEGDELIGTEERVWSDQFIGVSWYARKPPDGSLSVGGGAAYVYDAAEVKQEPVVEVTVQKPVDRYRWGDTVRGDGLMFVLVLPESYTIRNPQPMLREAKTFGDRDRMAVYWMPEGQFGAHVEMFWDLEKIEGDLDAALTEVNRMILDAKEVPSNIGVNVKETTVAVKITLRDLISERFDNNEVKDLCFELGIRHDDLPEVRKDKIRELILYCERNGQLADLVARAKAMRPQLPWPEMESPHWFQANG